MTAMVESANSPNGFGASKQNSAIPPKYCSVKSWLEMSGMSNSTFYELLKDSHLKAVKLGGRTLVDVEHGLAWMAALPPVQSRKARASQPIAA